jgi:hypothetical protein
MKEKMDIVVFIGGTINNGLDSATPGEGRWAQNLAKMLAEHGHNIDVVANVVWAPPSWGTSKPISNVTLSPLLNTEKEYDLALYMPWEYQVWENNQYTAWRPCHEVPIKAKYCVHNTFSWGASIKDDHICYERNHVLAYPYMQENHQFPTDPEDNPYPTFALPMPLYKEILSVNLKDRKNILWSTKDVFHPDWGKCEEYPNGNINHHCPRIGMATLRAIKRLTEKYEFDTHFLSTRFFFSELSSIAKELGVLDFVKSIPRAHLHGLLPQDELRSVMQKTRITAVVSGLLGSFGESIISGAVPLCYSGHLQRDAADKHGIKLGVFDATEDEIYDCMEKLYTDDDFYMKVIEDYRYEMRYYSYGEAYRYFELMVKELDI